MVNQNNVNKYMETKTQNATPTAIRISEMLSHKCSRFWHFKLYQVTPIVGLFTQIQWPLNIILYARTTVFICYIDLFFPFYSESLFCFSVNFLVHFSFPKYVAHFMNIIMCSISSLFCACRELNTSIMRYFYQFEYTVNQRKRKQRQT